METILAYLNKFEISPHFAIRYLNFIERCSEKNETIDISTERHHILPKAKCLYPEYKNLSKNAWNCVRLTSRQHFIAHLILSKLFLGGNQKRAMVNAILFMKRKNPAITSRQYDRLRAEQISLMRDHNPMFDEATVEKARAASRESWTPERREAASKSRIGVNNLTENGINRLSSYWTGVKKPPRTTDHMNKIIERSSKGIFITPFGNFASPGQAAKSEYNLAGLTRCMIDRRCKLNIDGFSFEKHEFATEEKRGKSKRTDEYMENFRKSVSVGVWKTPFGDFLSPSHAENSENNCSGISRNTIKSRCLSNKDGYTFIPK